MIDLIPLKNVRDLMLYRLKYNVNDQLILLGVFENYLLYLILRNKKLALV